MLDSKYGLIKFTSFYQINIFFEPFDQNFLCNR